MTAGRLFSIGLPGIAGLLCMLRPVHASICGIVHMSTLWHSSAFSGCPVARANRDSAPPELSTAFTASTSYGFQPDLLF